MAKQDKEKKGILSRAVGAIQWVKMLANPITWYILLGVLLLMLLAGIIAFISALPGIISEKFTQMITAFLGDNYSSYDVDDSEVLEMAKYLESMGYDVENYGFVESVTRENTVNGNTYADGKPSKGEITSVESKYLIAYIGEEKKMYKIAPENYSKADITEDYYLLSAITKEVPNNDNLQIYYYYQLKGTDINTLSKQIQEAFDLGKEEATVEQAKKIEEDYNKSINENSFRNGARQIGAGMIVLTGDAAKAQFTNGLVKWFATTFLGEINYEFKVDAENRKLLFQIEYVPEGTHLWDRIKMALGLKSDTMVYGIDLEEFLSKYGKPSEFMLAFHLATQAPDFVYKLATSVSTDTKVYIDIWPRKDTYIPVIAQDSKSTLIDLINAQDVSPAVHRRYKNYVYGKRSDIVRKIAERIWESHQKDGTYGSDDKVENWTQAARAQFDAMWLSIDGSTVGEIVASIKSIFGDFLDVLGDVEEWELIEIQGVNCSYKDLTELQTIVPSLRKIVNTATPYITKVVQHWYRNQYFTNEDAELSKAQRIATGFLDNLKYLITSEMESKQAIENLTEKIEEYKKEINEIEEDVTYTSVVIEEGDEEEDKTEEISTRNDIIEVCTILEKDYKELLGYFKDQNTKELLQNLFETKINSLQQRYGTTYRRIKLEDDYQPLEDFDSGGRPNVTSVIRNSFYRIRHTDDILQIHNPVFEDNSRYIRSWFKDKYIIYDGVTRPAEDRIKGEKKYIQGKTALDSLKAMLEKATTSSDNLIYMYRDVVEFMQDYAFDLDEIQETVAEKNLINIMPDYVPYTTWPSQYEQADSIWTKMLYKTSKSVNLVAPANCIVTKKEEIFELGILDSEGIICEYLYLCSDEDDLGNKVTDINGIKEGEYNVGDIIGTVTPIEETNLATKMVGIKLQMLTATKQKIDITTRMDVPTKSIDDIGALEEAVMVSVMSAVKMYKNQYLGIMNAKDVDLYKQECLAMVSTVLNRIASPYCKDTSLEHVDYDAMGVLGLNGMAMNYATGQLVETGQKESDPLNEIGQAEVRNIIQLALRGIDKTKEGTMLGATAYRKIWDKETYGENEKSVRTIDTELPDVSMKTAVGGGAFYVPNGEYQLYQVYYINDKIRSIFVQLNEQKDELNKEKAYTAGYGKYKISRTEEAEEELQKYFGYIEDTIYGMAESSCITSIVITNIAEEIDETSPQKFIDTFTLKVNSNVTVDITIKYNCTSEGKIIYDEMIYEIDDVERW